MEAEGNQRQDLYRRLLTAAADGDVNEIDDILSKLDDHVRERCFACLQGNEDELPLHRAAARGHLDALKRLMPDVCPDLVNARTRREQLSALHLAAIHGHTTIARWLLEVRGAAINLQDYGNYTALHFAVIYGQKDVVRSLVSLGAKLLILDEHSMFPVSYCKDGSMFEALFSTSLSLHSSFRRRESIQLVDANKRSILHYAAQYANDSKMISKLISEADPELVYAEDKDGDSFFHVAAKYGNMNVFEALDKARIDMAPLLPHRNGRDLLNSPGMYALLYDQREFFNELAARRDVKITLSSIVKALIFELIYKPEIQERLALFGSTLPTYLALYANKHFVFEFLLGTLLSLSQWDGKYYRTCLHWAIADRRADIVQKISTNKKLWQQWPGIQDRDGKTVQQLAFEQKNHMVMELLSGKASFKEHEEKLNKDREVYVQALNAILVGAALIASVTFAGWLQVPYESEFRSTAMRIYWATNSVSFFTAVATMCVTTIGLIPTPSQYVGVIVAQLRVTILLDAFLLALSLAAVMLAFAAAGFAALRHAHIYEYQVIMRSTAAVGGVICLITWLAYVYQLTNCTPSRTVLYSLLPSIRFSFLRRCWCPRWVEKMRTRLGDSSRLGYQNMEKEELSKRMDEDLVPIYLSPRLNSVTHTASECSIPDVRTLERLLKDLEIEDKDRFIMDISNQQRKVESVTYKNERIATLARRCKVEEGQPSEQ